jgi:Transposase
MGEADLIDALQGWGDGLPCAKAANGVEHADYQQPVGGEVALVSAEQLARIGQIVENFVKNDDIECVWGSKVIASAVTNLAPGILAAWAWLIATLTHSAVHLAVLSDWILSIAGAADTVAIAIEVPHGPLVDTLIDRGSVVYAINPKQLDRLRDRFSVAGAKNDQRDARVLADGLRTDRHLFRLMELRAWSHLAEELRLPSSIFLPEQHQDDPGTSQLGVNPRPVRLRAQRLVDHEG